MAIVKNKAKVGDYVKVIKKLPYEDQMGIVIGDIGVVNYVASTGKYSVHIDGKKNPKDKDTKSRAYGKLYDFWIPFECCKIVDSEELTKKCLFENADALDTCVTISNNGISINSGCTLTKLYTDTSITTTSVTNSVQDAIDNYFTKKKESEESKMSEIKNQKVVDLYFKRKKEALEEEFETINKSIVESDKNQIFIQNLKETYDKFIEENEIEGVSDKFSLPRLPLTSESQNKFDESCSNYKKKADELNNLKEEITALLSGCETYEQEMEILQTYQIVSYNTHYVKMEKTDFSKTN